MLATARKYESGGVCRHVNINSTVLVLLAESKYSVPLGVNCAAGYVGCPGEAGPNLGGWGLYLSLGIIKRAVEVNRIECGQNLSLPHACN